MRVQNRDDDHGGRGRALADLIEENRDVIMERWCALARDDLGESARLSDPALVDHVPELLDEIALALRRLAAVSHSAVTSGVASKAGTHGKQRCEVGSNIRAVVREYELLQQVIFDLIDETRADVTLNEIGIFTRAITEGISEAVDTFSTAQHGELREVELRFRRLTRSGIIGAVEYETSGRITAANDAFLQMLGYTRDDLQEGRLNFHALTPQPHRAATEAALDELRSKGIVRPYEKQYLRKDGTPVDVQVSGVALDDERRHGIALVLDIQERHRLQQERERLGQLQQELLAIVSHDLRNPLSAILLTTEWQLRRNNLEVPEKRSLERIRLSAERATSLIEDLLDFTQARLGGGISISRVHGHFHPLVSKIVDEVRAARVDRRIEHHCEGDDEGSWDQKRISQVIANLVANAVQHSPAETPVRVFSRGEDGLVSLEVHNEGEPVPAELRPHLFQPFRRGAGNGNKSLGLGLYIACNIVEAHHGRIEVRSSEEAGTVFRVELPREAS